MPVFPWYLPAGAPTPASHTYPVTNKDGKKREVEIDAKNDSDALPAMYEPVGTHSCGRPGCKVRTRVGGDNDHRLTSDCDEVDIAYPSGIGNFGELNRYLKEILI